MRRKLFFSGVVLSVLLCSSLVVSVDAASMWSQTYGGTDHDVAYSLVATSDGGYTLTGYTQSFGAGTIDIWLVKTDAFGNTEWNQTYGGTSSETARSLVATSDGGYAIAGIWNFTGPFGNGGDFWLVKTDANGVMEWSRTYGRSGKDEAYSLVATSDGGYALTGSTDIFDVKLSDFWLVKTDASGNMQWNQTYGGTSFDVAYSLVATSDGGYALTGSTNSFGAGGYDFWLIKTDASGNMQWNKTYGGTSSDFARSLVETSDGGYAVAGHTSSFGGGGPDSWLVKTDSFGNMQWNKTYGEGNAYSLVVTSDGGYALAGGSLLVKTDSFGNMQWNKTYGEGTALSLVAASDGGYALAGDTDSFGAGGADFWLVKTDEFGVVPEYTSWLVPALVLTATAFIIINKKRQLHKR